MQNQKQQNRPNASERNAFGDILLTDEGKDIIDCFSSFSNWQQIYWFKFKRSKQQMGGRKNKKWVKHHLKPYWNIKISCALKNTDDEHHLFSGAGYSYRLWNCTDRFQSTSNMFWLQEPSVSFISLSKRILCSYIPAEAGPFAGRAWDTALDLQDVDKTWTSFHELFISQVLMNHV